MTKEFEAGEWDVYTKKDVNEDIDESYIELRFRLKENFRQHNLKKEDLQQLKKDLEDLGKWRKFKELKKDLENE